VSGTSYRSFQYGHGQRANVAVLSLKQRLGLEKLQPRPPVPPRIYKKLYEYFDKSLQAPSTPRTPRHRDVLEVSNKNNGGTPRSSGRGGTGRDRTRTTEAQDRELVGDETPSRRSEKRKAPEVVSEEATARANARRRITFDRTVRDEVDEDGIEKLPPWVEAMIGYLTAAFDITESGHHILTGLKSVLKTTGYNASNAKPLLGADRPVAGIGPRPARAVNNHGPITTPQIPALLIILLLYTNVKVTDQKMDQNQYRIDRARGIAAVRETHEGYLQSDEDLMFDIGVFLERATRDGWLLQKWYTEMPMGPGNGSEKHQDVVDTIKDGRPILEGLEDPTSTRLAKTPLRRKEKHSASSDQDFQSAAGLKPGLGTMFQDAVDWLSDERRARHRDWDQDIRARIAEMA
jgi:origin recognition complex subunit 6